MLLTIQIVNYNSRKNLADCLRSIQDNIGEQPQLQIIVVNNEAEDLAGDLILPQGVEVVEAKKNLGFGRAHNLGARYARGEYILFLNPDTRILSSPLSRLTEAFKADAKIGIAGPLLVGEGENVAEEHFGAAKTPFSLVRSKIFPGGKKIPGTAETDWVSGGAMIIKRNIFKELGGFDENYFMYFEDVDLCLRAKKRGYRVVLVPEVRIFHKSGQSFSDNRQKKRYYYVSQDYYLRKHFGFWRAGIAKILRLPFYVKNVYLSK